MGDSPGSKKLNHRRLKLGRTLFVISLDQYFSFFFFSLSFLQYFLTIPPLYPYKPRFFSSLTFYNLYYENNSYVECVFLKYIPYLPGPNSNTFFSLRYHVIRLPENKDHDKVMFVPHFPSFCVLNIIDT